MAREIARGSSKLVRNAGFCGISADVAELLRCSKQARSCLPYFPSKAMSLGAYDHLEMGQTLSKTFKLIPC